jgi:uncharacterized phiE125 gp8 family phage protein
MPLIQTVAPTVEPVLLADAKTYLRLPSDQTSEDAMLAMLIRSARIYAETYTGRSFITQSWSLVLDSFPSYGMSGNDWGVVYSHPRQAVLLERGPVQSVTSIVYTSMAGTTVTVTSPGAPDYAIDLSGPVGRITPGFGKVWPIPLPQIAAVAINYVAGYGGSQASVPDGIEQWILMRVATIYENREEVAILSKGKVQELPYVDCLLDPYRVPML